MTQAFTLLVNPRQGEAEYLRLYRETIRPDLQAGRRGVLTYTSTSAYYRHQLRKLFHGPVLLDFATQVRVWCPHQQLMVRYPKKAWKEHLRMFVEPAFEDIIDPDTGEVLGVRELPASTERLSDDDFAEFLLQVAAYGAMEHGVVFTEQDYRYTRHDPSQWGPEQ